MNKNTFNKIKPLIIIALTILIPILLADTISIKIKSFFYAFSLSMKTVLVFVLPFIIFSFIFSCLLKLKQGAFSYVILLIGFIFMSNFIALHLGYLSMHIGMHFISFSSKTLSITSPLEPYWLFQLKPFISNDLALIIGFTGGLYFSRHPNEMVEQVGAKLNKLANAFLKNIFIPVLPLFILGFIFKLENDQIIQKSLSVYGPILLLILITQWSLILFWYNVAGKFKPARVLTYLRNVLPATLTGITTISSAASMPVLLEATKKNMNNSEQAEIIIPTIINVHTIGSAIGLTILALATMISFNMPLPSYQTFVIFAFFTALAKYAVAAVPGGVIIVMAPILEAYLGFNNEMIGLITAVYLILDPFGTAANVTGNGAFPLIFSRFYKWFKREASS